jgi:hypothetical protein
MWEWFNEVDSDDLKILVSGIVCLVGSITALLAYFFIAKWVLSGSPYVVGRTYRYGPH